MPYQGGGPSVIAAMGGHAPTTIAALVPALAVGRLRPLAVTSRGARGAVEERGDARRIGMPDFELTGNLGAVVRSGSPKDTINHLSTERLRAMQLPDVRESLIKREPGGPEEFDAVMRADVRKI